MASKRKADEESTEKFIQDDGGMHPCSLSGYTNDHHHHHRTAAKLCHICTNITMLLHKPFLAGRLDDHQDAAGPPQNTTYQVNNMLGTDI